MYKIVSKIFLNPTVVKMQIEAPLVAAKAKAGQFIILRTDASGERIPLTVAGCDRSTGAVEIIFQIAGATTKALAAMDEGGYISDFVGPLGMPSELDGIKDGLIVGGGVGCAIALPVARALKERGARVRGIIGFRSSDLVILEEEFRAVCDELIIVTDDGSFGIKGNVCLPLSEIIKSQDLPEHVFAIGPLVMMKFVTETLRPTGIPCTVSMNPIMIDGTGMCGGCRLTVCGEGKRRVKFACVDGPDFDGYTVDFDEAMRRNAMYRDFERHAYEQKCNLLKEGGKNG